jgi:hypothetical protein
MTNPNEARASVPVSDAVRELYIATSGMLDAADKANIRKGNWDGTTNMQTFARFEQMTRDDERENDPVRKVVFRYIDRMNDIAPECGDPAERILGEFVKDMNVVLKSQPDAIRQSKGRS